MIENLYVSSQFHQYYILFHRYWEEEAIIYMKLRRQMGKHIWCQCPQNSGKMYGLNGGTMFWFSLLRKERKWKQKSMQFSMLNKSNISRAKGNGGFWRKLITFNTDFNFILLRPQRFSSDHPSSSVNAQPDESNDSDSSSGNDDLFVNTNRPQCVFEPSDSESDSNENQDEK